MNFFDCATVEIALTIFGICVSIISIFISNYLGRKATWEQYKHDVKFERYNNYYVPFISKIYAGLLQDRKPADLSFEARSVFLDLITQNFKYIDEKTASSYHDFYIAFLDMLEYEENPELYPYAKESFNASFYQILQTTLLEAKKLAHELSLPPIASPLLDDCNLWYSTDNIPTEQKSGV